MTDAVKSAEWEAQPSAPFPPNRGYRYVEMHASNERPGPSATPYVPPEREGLEVERRPTEAERWVLAVATEADVPVEVQGVAGRIVDPGRYLSSVRFRLAAPHGTLVFRAASHHAEQLYAARAKPAFE